MELGKTVAANRMTGRIGQIAKRIFGMFATRRGRHRQYKKMGEAYIKEANHKIAEQTLGATGAKKERVLRQAGFIPKTYQINSLEPSEGAQVIKDLKKASKRYDAHQAIKNGELDWVKDLDKKDFQANVRALKKMDTKDVLMTSPLAKQLDNYERLANMAKGKDTELVNECINEVNVKIPLEDEALTRLADRIKEKETANIVPNALKELDGLDDDLKKELKKVLDKVAEPSIPNRSAMAQRDVKQVVDAIKQKRKQMGNKEFDAALKKDVMWRVEMNYLEDDESGMYSISALAVVGIIQAVQLGS